MLQHLYGLISQTRQCMSMLHSLCAGVCKLVLRSFSLVTPTRVPKESFNDKVLPTSDYSHFTILNMHSPLVTINNQHK